MLGSCCPWLGTGLQIRVIITRSARSCFTTHRKDKKPPLQLRLFLVLAASAAATLTVASEIITQIIILKSSTVTNYRNIYFKNSGCNAGCASVTGAGARISRNVHHKMPMIETSPATLVLLIPLSRSRNIHIHRHKYKCRYTELQAKLIPTGIPAAV